MNSNSPNT